MRDISLQLLTAVLASAGLGMVGFTYGAASAFFMSAALMSLILVSYLAARFSGKSLTVRRRVNDRVFAWEPLAVSLEITNEGRWPLFLLKVSEKISPWFIPDTPLDFIIPALWPGESAGLSYRIRGRKRGVHQVGPTQAVVSDPFGFFSRWVEMGGAEEAVVYPRPIPLEGAVMSGGSEAQAISTGERARGGGTGLEFYGIRDYQPGDELRRIHWPATAHHGRLTVIEFDQGVSDSIAVLLDCREGTDYGSGAVTTFEVAVQAAASLARWTLNSDGVFFLAYESGDLPGWTKVDRSDREHEALETLARVQPNAAHPLQRVAEWTLPFMPPGTSVWVITSRPDPGLADLARTLRSAGMISSVNVLVLDAASFDPAAETPSPAEAAEWMRPVGARMSVYRREYDLDQALRNAVSMRSGVS